MKYNPLWVKVWVGLVGAAFLFEMGSLLDGNDATPPLTQVLLEYVGWVAPAAVGVWIAVHFWRRRNRDA